MKPPPSTNPEISVSAQQPLATEAPLPKLYSFFRSGTSHRVRIALNLKGLDYLQIAVDLRKEEHNDPA